MPKTQHPGLSARDEANRRAEFQQEMTGSNHHVAGWNKGKRSYGSQPDDIGRMALGRPAVAHFRVAEHQHVDRQVLCGEPQLFP